MTKQYGKFGGMYIPEILIAPIEELSQQWTILKNDDAFLKHLHHELDTYAGRPTPLTEVPQLAKHVGNPRIFLKREDLLHTGAHKINNAIGQCLIAKRMGKTRIIAETGAGQHGVATATACARLGLQCVVYMGAKDIERQAPNVIKMQLLGATVVAVNQGKRTLKEAVNEALRDWSSSYEDTHYCLGSALGPYPFPDIVATLQSVIGKEARQQVLKAAGRLPSQVIACVGGGSNAIGVFSGFIDDPTVKLVGVEAGGKGKGLGENASRFLTGSPGVLHGCYTYLLQNRFGMIAETHSISAGLDYPAVGPQHAHLHEIGRATYCSVEDQQALQAFKLLAKEEGIIPALESSHAVGHVLSKKYDQQDVILINLSGRGDKDIPQLMDEGVIG
jgi:tryptophan synthase beta subunit